MQTQVKPDGTAAPLRVGLIGAGPWASVFHGPMLEASPAVELVGVWARRPEPASELAARHGAVAAAEVDELFALCDAVAFAVPPDVQAVLAVQAARAGKHLLLDKPLGLGVDQARAVADAVEDSGVVSQMVLTYRYMPTVRRFIAEVAGLSVTGARSAFIGGGSAPGSFFATPWRVAHGALLDVGPHVLDLLDATVGPIVELRAAGDPTRWTEVTCTHETGAVSQVSLSITTPIEPSTVRCELYGDFGVRVLDRADLDGEFADAQVAIPAEFADAVASGADHPLDAAHGLRLQELLAAAVGPKSV